MEGDFKDDSIAETKEVKEDFLHKINLETLKKELGMDSAESIGSFVKMKNPKGVYNWAKPQSNHGTRPVYDAAIRLLRAGATVETLFGVDYKPKQTAPAVPSPDFIAAHPDLLEGLQEQLIADLKKRGVFSEDNIRDIVRQEIERLLPGKTDLKI